MAYIMVTNKKALGRVSLLLVLVSLFSISFTYPLEEEFEIDQEKVVIPEGFRQDIISEIGQDKKSSNPTEEEKLQVEKEILKSEEKSEADIEIGSADSQLSLNLPSVIIPGLTIFPGIYLSIGNVLPTVELDIGSFNHPKAQRRSREEEALARIIPFLNDAVMTPEAQKTRYSFDSAADQNGFKRVIPFLPNPEIAPESQKTKSFSAAQLEEKKAVRRIIPFLPTLKMIPKAQENPIFELIKVENNVLQSIVPFLPILGGKITSGASRPLTPDELQQSASIGGVAEVKYSDKLTIKPVELPTYLNINKPQMLKPTKNQPEALVVPIMSSSMEESPLNEKSIENQVVPKVSVLENADKINTKGVEVAVQGSQMNIDPVALAEPEDALISEVNPVNQQLKISSNSIPPSSSSSGVVSEQMSAMDRFRPIIKFFISHAPSVSIDPFNRIAANDNALPINTSELSQPESSALGQAIIPLVVVKPNPEKVTSELNKLLENELSKTPEVEVNPVTIENLEIEKTSNKILENKAPVQVVPESSVLDPVPNKPMEKVSDASNPTDSVILILPESIVVGVNSKLSSTNMEPKKEETIVQAINALIEDVEEISAQTKPQLTLQPAEEPVQIVSNEKETSNKISTSNTHPSIISDSKPAKPNKPRPAFGIQSSNRNTSTFQQASANPLSSPFYIPGILLNPIEAIQAWHIPSIKWPSYGAIFKRVFRPFYRNRNSNTTSLSDSAIALRIGIENDCVDDDEEVVGDVKSANLKSMCLSDTSEGLASSKCDGFCVQHGFNNGTCIDGENCVCTIAKEEGIFGLIFKQLSSNSEAIEVALNGKNEITKESSVEVNKCQKCSCSSDCQKSGAYIGYCGNSCYCGLPWHDGSLNL